MTWPFRRRRTPPQPSAAARESISQGKRDLEEARELRVESQRVGSALRRSHEENHFATALAAAIATRSTP